MAWCTIVYIPPGRFWSQMKPTRTNSNLLVEGRPVDDPGQELPDRAYSSVWMFVRDTDAGLLINSLVSNAGCIFYGSYARLSGAVLLVGGRDFRNAGDESAFPVLTRTARAKP